MLEQNQEDNNSSIINNQIELVNSPFSPEEKLYLDIFNSTNQIYKELKQDYIKQYNYLYSRNPSSRTTETYYPKV